MSGALAQVRINDDQFSVCLSDLIDVCGGRDAKDLICIPHDPWVHQQPGMEDDWATSGWRRRSKAKWDDNIYTIAIPGLERGKMRHVIPGGSVDGAMLTKLCRLAEKILK